MSITLTVTPFDRLGTADLTASSVAATSTSVLLPNPKGQSFMSVTNGDSASHTVSVTPIGTVDGLAASARVVTVPAGHTMILGPYNPSLYNDTNGNVNFTLSATTSVTVGGWSQGAY